MDIKYNLPLPIVKYRRRKYRELLHRGDVVAYCRTDKYYDKTYETTGVMVIGDGSMFLIASNWATYDIPW